MHQAKALDTIVPEVVQREESTAARRRATPEVVESDLSATVRWRPELTFALLRVQGEENGGNDFF